MNCKYKFLVSAQEELDEILEYLTALSGGTKTTISFLDELEEKMKLVCANPEIFALSKIENLSLLGYRTFFVKKYVVLYFYREHTIFIAHIFHQMQDYARLV